MTNALYLIFQYENQCNIPVVGWTKKGPLGRPKWSDSQGKVVYPQPLNCCINISYLSDASIPVIYMYMYLYVYECI